jgi:hypothetical protein
MPFDDHIAVTPHTDNPVSETPAMRLARLIAALRAPLPHAFRWDFNVICSQDYADDDVEGQHPCGTVGCALGLACQLWPEMRGTFQGISDEAIGAFFGISGDAAYDVFFGDARFYGPWQNDDVTPAMVADALASLTPISAPADGSTDG